MIAPFQVPPRDLFCPIFTVTRVECCNASYDCSVDEQNKVCRYNITDMQQTNITVYIVTDFGYSFSLKISEGLRNVHFHCII